jgi:hypothetical protein
LRGRAKLKKEMIIDFYGKDLADYKKSKEIVEEARKLPGCIESNHYIKESVTFAGYSSIIIEWVVENKEFLVALAAFLLSLLRRNKENKIIINNVTFTNSDDLISITNKLKKEI